MLECRGDGFCVRRFEGVVVKCGKIGGWGVFQRTRYEPFIVHGYTSGMIILLTHIKERRIYGPKEAISYAACKEIIHLDPILTKQLEDAIAAILVNIVDCNLLAMEEYINTFLVG